MLWLGRYSDLMPIRARGSFHLLSVVRDERRSVVIVGSRTADRALVAAALARVAEAHRRIDHARVPRLVEVGEHDGTPFLELDCDAVLEGGDFLRVLADSGQKLSYGQGDALFTCLREAVQAAHRAIDPETGGPYCLGRVGPSNLLWSRSGRFWFVGFGHNFPLLKEDGRLEGHAAVYQAAEVLASEQPTPTSDYVAILMIARSLMAFCDISEIAKRVLELATSPDSAEAFEISRWFETAFISQRPEARPTMAEGIARSERLRSLLGVQLDVPGLEERAASVIAAADGELRVMAEGEAVLVAPDGGWVEVGSAGERRKLGRANQQILYTLMLAHRHEPGRAIGVWQLLEAGWPGEDPIPEAGANRVYVAIARLRQLGLRHVLERSGDGYRITPGAQLKVATAH